MMRRTLTLILLAALFIAPAAWATAGTLEAQRLESQDAAVVGGGAALLHARGMPSPGGLLALDISGAHIEAREYVRSGPEAAPVGGAAGVGRTYVVDLVGIDEDRTGVHRGTDVTVSLDTHDEAWTINGFAALPFDVKTTRSEMWQELVRDPVLDPTGIWDRDVSGTASEAHFTPRQAHGPHVVTTADQQQVSVAAAGDLVLEIQGADLVWRQGEEERILRGRATYSESGSGALDEQAHMKEERLIRIFVTAGEAHVAVGDEATRVQFAQASSTTEHSAGLVLLGATGALDGSSLDTTRAEVPGPVVASVTGGDAALHVDLREGGSPAGAVQAIPEDMSLIMGVGSLALLSLAGTLVLVWRAARSAPAMEEVEAALEQRSFRRAARMSRRILRRRPAMDEAMLSRAIALKRSGRPGQAVHEIHRYMQRRDCPDGTLHYVLGLAYLDIGDEDAGQEALAEAARRTPDLRPAPGTPPEVGAYA